MHDPPIPTAGDIMTRRVITLRADMPVIDAMRKLVLRRISGAPVLGADGTVIGIISEFDCLRVVASGLYRHEGWEESVPVGEIMSCEVVTIGPETDVFAITQLLVDKRIRRVPVQVDGRVVGIVSRRDVLKGVRKLRRALAARDRPREKGLYLSATDDSGDQIKHLLE